MTLEEAARVLRKLKALEYAQAIGNVAETCRDLSVPRSSFYRWRKAYAAEGRAGLIKKKPAGKPWPSQLPDEDVEKILHLRRQYQMGPQRMPGISSGTMAFGPPARRSIGLWSAGAWRDSHRRRVAVRFTRDATRSVSRVITSKST
jgi:transposase-like protein